MLRILYCTDTLMAGGVERQVTELITRLDRTQFEPSVLCLYGERVQRSLHFLEPLQAADVPVQMLDLGWGAADKVRGIWAIARAGWRIRPHILHSVNYHSNLMSRLARPLLPLTVKLVGAVRNEYTPHMLRYERWGGWLNRAIVVNSPRIRQTLIETAHLAQERVICIYNGVDIERFATTPDPDLRKRIAPDAARVLVMMGRIGKQKSPHLLAQAVGLLKSRGELPAAVQVVIVGESDGLGDPFLQLLNDAIKQYGLDDVVQHQPKTTQPESYYHAADVTVLASLWEGLPNVMLESLAAGRPVIISEAANQADVIQHGVNGWIVRTNDVAHLADTLRQVLSLPDEALLAMRPTCRHSAQPFAMQHMVEQYQTLYERVAGREG